MRIHCGARYGGMSADTKVHHGGFTAEFGGMLRGPSWQAAIEDFGTHRFTLRDAGTRPVMLFHLCRARRTARRRPDLGTDKGLDPTRVEHRSARARSHSVAQ